jgi:hypothetical protein
MPICTVSVNAGSRSTASRGYRNARSASATVGQLSREQPFSPIGLTIRALVAGRVAGARQQPDAGQHFGLAVVGDVGRTREVDPFGRAMRPLQLEPLDVDRHTGKQAVAAAVVEV